MSNEVAKLIRMDSYAKQQRKELLTIQNNNNMDINVQFDIYYRLLKLEKIFRISTKLLEIIVTKLHYSTEIDLDERNRMFKNLERTREDIVEQQWEVHYMIENLRNNR